MRTIAVILSAVLLALKDVAAEKDKPFQILAGELKHITDAVKTKVEHHIAKWKADVAAAQAKDEPPPAADLVCEVFESYSAAAQHTPGVMHIVSARKLSLLLAQLPESAKPAPPKP